VKYIAGALAAAVAGLVLYERHRSRHNRRIYYNAMDIAARAR
jgi:hypothetical protein